MDKIIDDWIELTNDNQLLGFLIAYVVIAFCIFAVMWLVMILLQKNWAYSIGYSLAFAAILPFLVLAILMLISGASAKDEDGESKPDIKNTVVGAASTIMLVKAIIDWPKKAGRWMQINLSSEPVKTPVKTPAKTDLTKQAVFKTTDQRKASNMAVKKASRRHPEDGDVVVIDYPNMNAIAVCTDVSEDPYVSENQGWQGHPAYRFDYICGVGLNNMEPYPLKGHIWLQDDIQHMSIMGVNGYALPRRFYNVDLVQLFRDNGFDIEFA